MASSMCYFNNLLPWITILVPVFVCLCFSGYGWLSIFLMTTLVLVLSSIFLTFSKEKQLLVEKSVTDAAPMSCSHDHEYLAEVDEFVSEPEPERQTITEKKGTQEAGADQIHDYLVRSPDSFSETESINHSSTSDDSEVDWPYLCNVVQSPDCSDDSISDEESLIEIALPSGHYVGPHKEDEPPKSNLQKKFPDFSTEALFRQCSLMEYFAEINEEENLIEIDISMGSIKCSRFEIEA